jgi:hypothetical protein
MKPSRLGSGQLRDLIQIPRTTSSSSSSEASSAIDNATNIVINIMQLLKDQKCSRRFLELESLHQILTLTALAIQMYDPTSLGQYLITAAKQEAELCCATLQQFFETINGYRWGLNSTRIYSLWSQIWSRGGEEYEFRMKLAAHRNALSGCLVGLSS